MDVETAQNKDADSHDQGEKEANGNIDPGAFIIAAAQSSRQICATSHANHKGNRLEDRHGRKNNANGCGGFCADLTHKIGIGHIVNGCNQHGNDGWDCKAGNDLSQRSLKHHL